MTVKADAKKISASQKKDSKTHSSEDVSKGHATYQGIQHVEENTEFGGPIGVTAIMIWSHYILLYFWYCLETADGRMVIPNSFDSLVHHLHAFKDLFFAKGLPSTTTWLAYLGFFVAQIVFAATMPGLTMQGLPTAPHGIRLPYHCNGYICYYMCVFGVFLVDYLGIFPMTYLSDHYGEVLMASIVIGDVTSLWWYFYGILGEEERVGKNVRSGNFFYDYFMGTVLYPRIGEVDIKMVAEARWSWTTLLLITLSCAVKQYRSTGSVSPQLGHMLLAHWLYSNATAKGEHCIPCTWDMFHENFGWMLNFWNISGVPFLYCFQSLYILKNQSVISSYYPTSLAVFNCIMLLVAYYIFDTANCQKAMTKISVRRSLFPDLPWAVLPQPVKYLNTPRGNLLIGGWYAYARKMQYTGDILMALSWGIACGFESLLPYFYVVFFTCMIVHRQGRDEIRCKEKYGKHWDEYTALVPNVFVPSKEFFVRLFTGKEL